MEKEKLCEVCNKREAVGVCASRLGAVSHRYCRQCLESGAEPYGTLVAVLMCIGKERNNCINNIIEASLKEAGKTHEELEKDIEDANASYAAFASSCKPKTEIPGYNDQDEVEDPIAYERWTSFSTGWQWFTFGKTDDLYYGYVRGFDDEVGDYTADELAEMGASLDDTFTPIKLSEIDITYPNQAL